MTSLAPAFRPLTRRPAFVVGALALLAALAVFASQALIAQVEGDRGIPAVATSNDISVGGIEVNVVGDNAKDARYKGWKLAQRQGWVKLGGDASISDADLENMVTAMVIEHEQLGPRRYIATLGVVFDRAKAGPKLGATAAKAVSAPMLTLPVLAEGGTYTVYETRNAWQQAWAQFQPGNSPVDYVRPSGSGGESLLLNFGQMSRRSRSWWRTILDEFGASDVLIPIAELHREWPGGPVTAKFTARYGPDQTYLDSFTLTAPNDGVPDMLATAVRRFDTIYSGALNSGVLHVDPTLTQGLVSLNPTVAALINSEKQDRAQQEAAAAAAAQEGVSLPVPPVITPQSQQPAAVSSYVVQFATPEGRAVDAALSSVRGTPGVRGAATSSIAIGGVSVMRVSYGGSLEALASALKARGWNVSQSGNQLSISR